LGRRVQQLQAQQIRPRGRRGRAPEVVFFVKQKTAYEIGLGIPAEPLFRSNFWKDGRANTISFTVFPEIVPSIGNSFINTMKNINHTRSSISDDIRKDRKSVV